MSPNPLDLTSPPTIGKEIDKLDAIPFQETSSSCTEFINEEATIDSTIHQSSDSHVTIEHSGSGFDDVTIKQDIEQSDDSHVTEHITDSSSVMCPRPQLNTVCNIIIGYDHLFFIPYSKNRVEERSLQKKLAKPERDLKKCVRINKTVSHVF